MQVDSWLWVGGASRFKLIEVFSGFELIEVFSGSELIGVLVGIDVELIKILIVG